MMKMMRITIAACAAVALGACASHGDAPGPAAATDDAPKIETVDCPGLAKVKYPFLTCVKDAEGNVVFAGGPDIIPGSQMPPMDPFVESDAYIGN